MPNYDKLRELVSHRVTFDYDTGAKIVGYVAATKPATGPVQVLVMSRGGIAPAAAPPGLDMEYECVPVTRVDISSTEVRRRIHEGLSVRFWVPDGVLAIIRREKLYGIR